jgi:hypothetical protein
MKTFEEVIQSNRGASPIHVGIVVCVDVILAVTMYVLLYKRKPGEKESVGATLTELTYG